MRGHKLLYVAALAGLALVGTAGCDNPGDNSPPPFPSYAEDVQPILFAHCVRCHGSGGTLNADPDIAPINSTMKPNMMDDFTTYAGAKTFAPLFKSAIDNYPMPPPPSERLDAYTYDTLITWAKNPQP
jgi:hypothetical protein